LWGLSRGYGSAHGARFAYWAIGGAWLDPEANLCVSLKAASLQDGCFNERDPTQQGRPWRDGLVG
jgi:hypothetical protein